MENHDSFEISLPHFKGPFDLLLFFIQRDELDIYDIPIAKITENFLDYMHKMQEMNIELASEFILVAATLMKIKAQMLLPRKILDDEGNELDPRQELVQKILDYKQFKELSQTLMELESEQIQHVARTSAIEEIESIAKLYQTDFEMENVSISKLMRTFQVLLQQKYNAEKVDIHQIKTIFYDISIEKSKILERIQSTIKLDFTALFETIQSKIHAIYYFLAILELVQEQKINIVLSDHINQFWISLNQENNTMES
jgi:segregation and condensation protein A